MALILCCNTIGGRVMLALVIICCWCQSNCIVYSYLYGQAAGCDECGEGEPGCVQPEPGGGQAAGGGAGHLTQALVAHPPTSLVQPDIHNILKISLCIPGRVFNSDTKLLITNQ